MAYELTSEQVFERNCAPLDFVTYDQSGAPGGVYATGPVPRYINTFERLIYAMFSEHQVEALINRVVTTPGAPQDKEEDALMNENATQHLDQVGTGFDGAAEGAAAVGASRASSSSRSRLTPGGRGIC